MKWSLVPLLVLTAALPAAPQRLNPIQWSFALEPDKAPPGGRVLGRVTAGIDPGWHLYSLSSPKPIIARLRLEDHPAVESYKVYQPRAEEILDPFFKSKVGIFSNEVTFLLEVQVSKNAPAGPAELSVESRFQSCDDKQCLPPRRTNLTASLAIDPGAAAAAPVIPAGYTAFDPGAPAAAASGAPPADAPPAEAPASQGMAMFLLVAFGFGLAAIFTPCVFPMIPITVSYFLNKPAGARGRSVLEALIFCLGIIVLFSSLGLLATALLGPFGIVQLGSNVWVNAFIAAVFLVFGLSLLGAFEITIPSSVLTRLDRASQGGGVAGTLLMGLTFSLTAFACVGPFVGTLLAASVQGGGPRPLLGMVSFASGLALPFFFLALFPSYLKRLPKSGGWLDRVKVVMGFLILAAMFKYLSSIDQVMQWNVLTRERFLAAWIVLFSLAGLYLLGFLRLQGVKPEERVGLARLLTGAALLIFSISLLPGMFGARLGELDAYVPAASGGAAGEAASGGLPWLKNDYAGALAKARAENKLVFVAFTGYACTNCHWMKANMFTRPEIAGAMREFVLLELYTDGTDSVSEENQKLQENRFRTIAIPYYAILDGKERVVATFPGLTRDAPQFAAFLASGRPAEVSAN
jgi:thiol:disulfide interchange protein DsbD